MVVSRLPNGTHKLMVVVISKMSLDVHRTPLRRLEADNLHAGLNANSGHTISAWLCFYIKFHSI